MPQPGYERHVRSLGSVAALAGLLLVLMLGIQYATSVPMVGGSSPRAPADARPDDLVVLNQAFRAAYAQNRAATLAGVDPVILHEGDSVVLLHGGRRIEKYYLPPRYDHLKAIAHIPLALYVMLERAGEAPLSDPLRTELLQYRDLIVAAGAVLEHRGFSAVQLERQRQVVADALAFLDGVVARGQVEHEDVIAFTRRMAPLVLANAADAAHAQLDALHAQVTAWQQELAPAQWKQLRVVIMGSHMPRVDNLATQYFSRLLGPPIDDRRLIYAEALFDEKKALDLLGTTVLDTAIGAAFFQDPLRMHRDLLGDAAAAYIKELQFAR